MEGLIFATARSDLTCVCLLKHSGGSVKKLLENTFYLDLDHQEGTYIALNVG